jgi:hypothetical protein
VVFFYQCFGIYGKLYIFVMSKTGNEMKTIEITIQEIWQATRPIVQKSKKAYSRKQKHKNKEN